MLASALSHHQVWALGRLYVIIIFNDMLIHCSNTPVLQKKKSVCYVISQGQMKK